MKYSKMIKILSSYKDKALFEIVDSAKFDFDKNEFSYPVRDVILLSDVIKQFEEKTGVIYEAYQYADNFKELIKLIEADKSKKIEHEYEDSYQEFKIEWNKRHPDESYEDFKKQKAAEDAKRFHFFTEGLFSPSSARFMFNGHTADEVIKRLYN